MDYKNGKIYKLQCDDGHFYIGSTTSTLVKRMWGHTSKSKKYPDRRIYKHIDGKWDSVRIVLIEEFPCENKNQLVRKEDEHIRLHSENQLCLNTYGAVRLINADIEYTKRHQQTRKVYQQTHREEINATQRARRAALKSAGDSATE
jgi:predicted GIY-YIG superfamily endonuclease